uniref:Uncharacterized protein n=1 Tax=Kalanchoe fedtschenkoi TaxID=63787 RepID=A0A7N0VCP6_KALFE
MRQNPERSNSMSGFVRSRKSEIVGSDSKVATVDGCNGGGEAMVQGVTPDLAVRR